MEYMLYLGWEIAKDYWQVPLVLLCLGVGLWISYHYDR